MLAVIIFFISLFLVNAAEAEKICVKYVDGEKFYTNICDISIKKIKATRISHAKLIPQQNSIYSRQELEKIVEEKSQIYGVDPKLIKEMIKEESNWNVNAISPKGAMGIMQLMPSTAVLMGIKNPFNPYENIDAGIRYMKYLLEKFRGNLNLALAAYNAGPTLVESIGRIPNITETKNYVKRISLRYSGNTPVMSGAKKPKPIKAIVLSDGTVLYTNREDLYIWTTKQ